MAEQRQAAGRVNQKRRTRAALLAGAIALLREGVTPTVAEAAERAAISRATAYRYFPAQDALLVEAAFELTTPDINALLAAPEIAENPVARLNAIQAAMHRHVVANEPLFRTLLRLSLEPAGEAGREDATRDSARTGRRVAWTEQALAPVRDRFDTAGFERLVAGLTPLMGIEAIVALCDVCGLTRDEALVTAQWSARAMLAGALAKAGA